MATVRKRHWETPEKGEARAAWVAYYSAIDAKTGKPKRHQKTFATKRAADEWLTDTKGQIRRGTHTPDSVSMTVCDAGRKWLDHCEREGLERSTVKQRREHVELHMKPFIGQKRISQLTAPMVHDFTDTLRDEGRSHAMVRKVLTSLKTLISYAQSRGLVAQNVAREVRLKTNGRHKREVQIPTKAELRKLLDTVADRWRPLIVTAIFTGMRASELRGLPWDNVDFKANVIRIRQRADAWGTLGPPKSKAGHRDIPMAPMVRNTLKEWKLACPKSSANLVFPNTIGNVEAYANFYHRGFLPLLEACSMGERRVEGKDGKPKFVANYTFHALRHAAASLFIEQGMQPKRVQTLMGHASINMTMDTYGHLFPDPKSDQDAMAQVEARLLG